MENFAIEILKALADDTRINIIKALKSGKMTGGQIEKIIEKSQSTTSQQLKKLIDTGIITFEQVGTKKYYQPKDPQVFDLIQSIESFISITRTQDSLGSITDIKTLFIGLDGSGKTSILLSLVGNKNLMVYASLPGTKGYNHLKKVADDLNLTDFKELSYPYYEAGGQEIYREEYLSDPMKYFGGFDRILYVIDVQDFARYEESIAYLSDIISKMEKNNINCQIDVFFHKYDPGIENIDLYSDQNVKENLVYKIREISPKFSFRFYKTSIFTIFRRFLFEFQV